MATSNQDREQNINEGLRKLEEFQRRRLQGTQFGHVASPRPATSVAASRDPNTTPVPAASPTQSTTGASAASPASGTGRSSSVAVDFVSQLQALHDLVLGAQVGEGARETPTLDELQRRWSEVMEASAAARSQRQAMQANIDGLQNSYLQATKTIDLLVAEKSRLKTTLEDLEVQLRGKAHEVEVYESEVRGLRERATTNEGQMQALRAECERLQENTTNACSYEALLAHKKRMYELAEQQDHCAEKLQQMQRAYEQTRAALECTTKELSVAQAYIQQLSGGTEQLQTAKATNNEELEALREEVRTLINEKSAAELISRNLEASNRGLQDRVGKLTHDLHQLTQAVRTIGTISLKAAPVQSPIITGAAMSISRVVPEKLSIETQCEFPSNLESERQQFEVERQTMKMQLEAAQRQTEQYGQQLASFQAQMVMTGEQLQKAKLDSSRACVQNRELKSQLEELQDVFIKLSNEKLDLTEQLNAERHRAQQLDNELRRIDFSSSMESSSSHLADSQAAAEWAERYHALEKQHAACKETIMRLQSKIPAGTRPVDDLNSGGSGGDVKGQNESPSVSISEYEFVEQTPEHSVLVPSEHDLDTDNISTSSRDSTSKSRDAIQRTSICRHELQAKFREALQKIETLEEQKNYLEHQVVQLQMETDTISDYIQLYQQQRAALNRRQQDKEAQMNQLLSDREELRRKVSQLQALVGRLVPFPVTEQSQSESQPSTSVAEESEINREVLAREIFSTLEDINQASSSVSFDGFKCTSCHGCQGKLISL